MASEHSPSDDMATQPLLPSETPAGLNGGTREKYLKGIKITAILHLIGGPLLVVFGIVAIVFWARYSFFATPIWTGLLIFMLTGCIGLWAASTQKRANVGGYITMSVIAATTSGALLAVYITAAVNEYYVCQPGRWDTSTRLCHNNRYVRIAMDSLIAATALFEFLVSLTSFCVATYYACSCCRTNCCCDNDGTTTPSMDQASSRGGVVSAATTEMQQGNGVLINGPEAPGQLPSFYLIQQVPGQPYQQAVPIQLAQLQTFPLAAGVQPINNPQVFLSVSAPGGRSNMPHQPSTLPVHQRQLPDDHSAASQQPNPYQMSKTQPGGTGAVTVQAPSAAHTTQLPDTQ